MIHSGACNLRKCGAGDDLLLYSLQQGPGLISLPTSLIPAISNVNLLQVGVGAFITNDKQQVLLVQEASGITRGKVSVWQPARVLS